MKVSTDLLGKQRLLLKKIVDALTRNITFEDNIRAAMITVDDTGTAHTEFTVTHNLGKTPTGYIATLDSAGVVYDSSVDTWNPSTMALKCSVANAKLRIVVF